MRGAAALPVGRLRAATAQRAAAASPEAADIAACLCLRQAVDALGAKMTAREGAYEASRQRGGGARRAAAERPRLLNVDNPHAVAQFRQLLERRDAAFRRSSGAVWQQYLTSAVELYNDGSANINARCADRPRNPVLLTQVQATLICPPPG